MFSLCQFGNLKLLIEMEYCSPKKEKMIVFVLLLFFFFFLYCYLMGHNADSTTCPQNSRQNDCLAVLQQCTCKSNIKKHTTLLIKVIMPT